MKPKFRPAAIPTIGMEAAAIQRAISSGGRPLDTADREFMERRFNADFGEVRMHSDSAAAKAADSIDAHAFSIGRDVVFGTGTYRPGSATGRRLLAHELAHVVDGSGGTAIRRYAACQRLLGSGDTPARRGPTVRESAVQEFLADELSLVGQVERELPVPAGSAAPWRTEGRFGEGSTIDPQLIDWSNLGKVDIAMMGDDGVTLEFLEVKVASWQSAAFAEQQMLNYVSKGIEALPDMLRIWQRRGYTTPYLRTVTDMPMSRYATPQDPVEIDGQQVALSWCRDGVIVFKPLDVDNEELHYCGVSDQGQTDRFLGRILGEAEEAVARALARRLNALSLGPVNVRLLLDRVRQNLQASIRYYLEQSLRAVCAAALEITLAAVLRHFIRTWLSRTDVLDVLLGKVNNPGDPTPLPIGQVAASTAAALTIGYILMELAPLVFVL